MSGGRDFAPPQKPPAKVKDRGLVSLVTSGKGAYNAKEGRLLLLPRGLSERRALMGALEGWIASMGGVLCGGARTFQHLKSLAERYMKDHGLEIWGSVGEELCLGAVFSPKEQQVPAPPFGWLKQVPEVFEGGYRVLWAVPSDPWAMNCVDALQCGSCGGLFSRNHPFPSGDEEPSALPAHGPAPEEVHTPAVSTIEDLCSFLNVKPEDTIKTVAVMDQGGGQVAALLIPGHMNLSYPKASRALKFKAQMASDEAVRQVFGDCAGFLGPVGIPGTVAIIAHDSLKVPRPMVAGANRRDRHLINLVPLRDFTPAFADLASLSERDLCPSCGGPLEGRHVRLVGEWVVPDDPGDLSFPCSSREGRTEYRPAALFKVDLEALHLALEEMGVGIV
ncbi:MAG: hypothetical protein N2315_02255 [Thermanaerothrix sp.]|nr:hypothetical protein [Thermanaerothrix sp.]